QYLYQKNCGRSAARNFGARNSEGKILTFLDSDDEALPDWLKELSEPFADSTTGIVCCGFLDVSSREEKEVFPYNMGPMYQNQMCLFHPPGTFAIQREIFQAVGGYTEEIAFSENTELAMRLVPQCFAMGKKIVSLLSAK